MGETRISAKQTFLIMDYHMFIARLKDLKALQMQAIRRGNKEKAEVVSILSIIRVICSQVWLYTSVYVNKTKI